jgi:hypothetical protein
MKFFMPVVNKVHKKYQLHGIAGIFFKSNLALVFFWREIKEDE